MTLRKIREIARSMNISNYSRRRKADLIRIIQQTEGNAPCFQRISGCMEYGCLWRDDCQE
ncbi:MAG: hypothetical protein FJ118_11920 [Deltaproteobacteria bacterium]|nr:hypothetical protein [Deltaproteobacteria bacterium]